MCVLLDSLSVSLTLDRFIGSDQFIWERDETLVEWGRVGGGAFVEQCNYEPDCLKFIWGHPRQLS